MIAPLRWETLAAITSSGLLSPEILSEIVINLRQVEVLQSQGMAATNTIRQIGVSEVT